MDVPARGRCLRKRDHRVRQQRIIARERPAPGRERLAQRSLRPLGIAADLMMENAEPIESIREREVALFHDRTRLREQFVRLRGIVFDGVVVKAEVLQRDRVGPVSRAERIGRHVAGALGDLEQGALGRRIAFENAGTHPIVLAAGGFLGMTDAIRQLTGAVLGEPVGNANIGLVSGFGMINYDRGLASGATIFAGPAR